MRLNLISSRLATRARIRQVEASLRADAAANAADRAIGSVWGQFLDLLRRRPHVWEIRHQARAIARQLYPAAAVSIDKSLRRTATWGHRETARALTGTLSAKYLRAAAARQLFESKAHLLEDRPRKMINAKPGVVQMALKAFGMRLVDLGRLLREPVVDQLDEESQKDLFASLLFPPPSADLVAEIIYGTVKGVSWIQRLEGATRTRAQAEDLAEIVGGGVAAGKTAAEIARDLRPVVDGVRSTARRIARTESLRVSHGVQMKTWEGLGELIIGYQLHATLDQNTRPWHAARNGIVYYENPGPGQKGYDERPDPPLEPDGSIAWH